MHYFEAPDYCDRSEYHRGEPERLHGHELMVDELYTMMMAIRSIEEGRRAAKCPVRLNELDGRPGDMFKMTFEILDHDMRAVHRVDGTHTDGYVYTRARLVMSGRPIVAAYFKRYDDGLSPGDRAALESLTMSAGV